MDLAISGRIKTKMKQFLSLKHNFLNLKNPRSQLKTKMILSQTMDLVISAKARPKMTKKKMKMEMTGQTASKKQHLPKLQNNKT